MSTFTWHSCPSAPGNRGSPMARLLAIADDAGQRQSVSWSLEAQLVAWELERSTDAGSAAALRLKMEGVAKKYGYGRIVSRLHQSKPLAQGTPQHS